MKENAKNLRRILNYFDIKNNMLAKALSVDPALVSRWLNGSRQLSATSESMDKLCNYLLSKTTGLDDMEWLKGQFQKSGLATEMTSVGVIKQNLIIWLASDGENLKQSFGKLLQKSISELSGDIDQAVQSANDYQVRTGFIDIAFCLDNILQTVTAGTSIDIHMTREDVVTITHNGVSSVLMKHIAERNLHIRLLISLSNDTKAMSKLITTYMQQIVTANLSISVVHGMAQAIVSQMSIIIGDKCAVMVTEALKAVSPPIATLVYDEMFIKDIKKSFERAFNYSQPILHIYNDSYSRNILEIIFLEFCMQGDLDVIKDSINPMYMSIEGYNRVLKKEGHKGEQYKWRSEEFVRFNTGFHENYRSGNSYREVISLSRLHKIVEQGFCKMPSLYFIYKGVILLDAKGCIDVLEGYIHFLNLYPNFSLAIVDDIPELYSDCCWRLKQNHHIALSYWDKDEPFLIYSDQLMLTYEFQNHFNNIWMKSAFSVGGRSKTIDILNDIITKIKEKYIK